MTDTTENASSVHPEDLANALAMVNTAKANLLLAFSEAKAAHGKEYDETTEEELTEAGRQRDLARFNLEEACKILARLAALRD
jgi:hypothetical protein